MLRGLVFAAVYLLLAGGALLGGSVLQVTTDIATLRAACADGLTLAAMVTAYGPIWLAVALLSLPPVLLLRRTAPHLAQLGWAAWALGLAGFVTHAIEILRTFHDGCGGVLDSSASVLAGILILAAAITHLVVAVRAARSLTRAP